MSGHRARLWDSVCVPARLGEVAGGHRGILCAFVGARGRYEVVTRPAEASPDLLDLLLSRRC